MVVNFITLDDASGSLLLTGGVRFESNLAEARLLKRGDVTRFVT
jgi:hypothetical protein